ncbi:MAG: hypothetical protein NTX57_11305 [Armatimonadetes bacterium]|nr:hypothetical protein [Armatimonadota bacterium]
MPTPFDATTKEPDAATLAIIERASAIVIEQWAETLDQVETWPELVKV